MSDWRDLLKKWWPVVIFIGPLIIGYWNIYAFYCALLLVGFAVAFIYKEWEHSKDPKITSTESNTYAYGEIKFPFTIQYLDNGDFNILLGRPKCQREYGGVGVCNSDSNFHYDFKGNIYFQCVKCRNDVFLGKMTHGEFESIIMGYIRQNEISKNE